MKKDLIILKLGGSVITKKKSKVPRVDTKNLERLTTEIAEVYKSRKIKLILIHGAGSYGHQIVKRTGIDKGITREDQILDFAETQRLQNELNSIVTKTLIEKGVPAIPCQASSHTVMKKGKLERMDINAIKGFLDIGLVPTLYGVPAYDTEQKCSILSGDVIGPYLAVSLNAKKIIHGSDVDGVFSSDPKKDPKAKLIPMISYDNFNEVKKMLSGSTAVDVTGGMAKKIQELFSLTESGIESEIVNATKPGIIKRVLSGEKGLGTLIKWK